MAADNIEGPEVDLLIRELSSPVPKKAAAPARRPGPGGTNRLILPERPRRKLLAGMKFPAMPAMPSISIPRVRMPAFRMPSFRMPSFATSLIAMPQTVLVARICVGLALSLSVAMPFWPYPRTGLWWMVFYLFAVGMVLVSGVWSAKLTWATRLGYAHVVALSIVLWGITLVTEETMRNGYFTAEASGLW